MFSLMHFVWKLMFQDLMQLNLTPDSNKTVITILGNTGKQLFFYLYRMCVSVCVCVFWGAEVKPWADNQGPSPLPILIRAYFCACNTIFFFLDQSACNRPVRNSPHHVYTIVHLRSWESCICYRTIIFLLLIWTWFKQVYL